ncbi:TetR/AcrR family transcriptional regulator [Nocardia sp. NPDC050697]|uniref:TetR/AcrR family transcriptional regulator n=1 Tax=Nocardia sp. NPDC050697 TaxID=3155158 RepID=UPI0033DDA406
MRLFTEKGSTQITVSELAQEANVARGTLYRNVGSVDELFDRVVAELSADMHLRVSAAFAVIDDPAARLATGMRLWVRYAFENPLMGRFAVRFGLTAESLRTMMTGPPKLDLDLGIETGRYNLGDCDVTGVVSLVLGATISAMWIVLEGHQTWREAGSATAELVLRSLGIEPADARAISRIELPRLPAG